MSHFYAMKNAPIANSVRTYIYDSILYFILTAKQNRKEHLFLAKLNAALTNLHANQRTHCVNLVPPEG